MFRLFKKTIAPPPDPLLPVLAFIGDFERGTFDRAIGYHSKYDHPQPEAISLRNALINSGLVYGNEWVDFIPDNYIKLQQPDFIETLNANDLRIAITGILRTDRLSEGYILSTVCKTGLALELLKRLKKLHESGEILPLLQHT